MKHVVTAARERQTVLVTGFGAFPGHRRNPTTAILHDLEGSRSRLARLGIDLRCVILPVVYDEIEQALRRAVALHRPDSILHLGLAGRRRVISVETRAINRAGPLHHDAARRLPAAQVLVPGASLSLAATYPASELAAALARVGLPARRSIDAGDYVCNATLFGSLAGRLAPRIGFLHVPRPMNPSQPVARTRHPRPTLADLSRAALVAVLVTARRRARPQTAPAAVPRAPPRDAAPEDRSRPSRVPAADRPAA